MIVCLGWGSLIWNPGVLPVQGGWHPDGPQLPIEFTRVSGDGCLTLAITEGATGVTALWTHLSVASLDEGIQALAERERVPEASIRYSIGYWSPERLSRHSAAKSVGVWAHEHGHAAVIWTALKPGFRESRDTALTCDQALAHLRSLEGVDRTRAEEYVRRAPPEIRTPYRSRIEQEFGWTPI